ncbi:MAG: hypothetical protein S4CHLAM45_03380 [Chlamydiales bacterium]|nr:hypothetical protein [Chlamydiales bacterium]MCH9619194.1 hypothetical protein [Chlamydiales bacterium]MCH9622456.1 hypothetical protein [Chlamydiales bacterium]
MKRSLGIHSGVFHADEVSAAAFLLLYDLIDEDKIRRTRDPAILKECEYVCDVGGVYDPKKKLFDHHQSSYLGPMSSSGMVLLYLKESGVISEKVYAFFYHSLVKGIDDHDNGRSVQHPGVCTFSHVIANFPPVSYDASEAEMDQAFHNALAFTLGHLKRIYDRFVYNKSCQDEVRKAMEGGRKCLFFEKSLPWIENFFSLGGTSHPALFLIMPAAEHWKLRGIPPDLEHRMQVRLPLPAQWAGLLGDELKKASGIKGAVFCHKGRFTSVWETKEDAEEALQKVLKLSEGDENTL